MNRMESFNGLMRHLKQLRASGFKIDSTDFQRVTPYAHGHVLPCGQYIFDMRRRRNRERPSSRPMICENPAVRGCPQFRRDGKLVRAEAACEVIVHSAPLIHKSFSCNPASVTRPS